MNIVFFEIQGWEKPFLRSRLKKHVVAFYHDPLNKTNIEKYNLKVSSTLMALAIPVE